MSIAVRIAETVSAEASHRAGTLGNEVLRRIEELIGSSFDRTLETGCGKSTIFFSIASSDHLCFALDDRQYDNSSVSFVEGSGLFRQEACNFVFGPTQKTIPARNFDQKFDVVLLDGPHGFPFPDLEYYFIYPHINMGGFLIVDDVHIPSIGRFADILFEDEMFDLVETVVTTAIFRRTTAPIFDPLGDGWWQQRYNRRRVSPKKSDIHLPGETPVDYFTSQKLDHALMNGELRVRLGQPPQGAIAIR
jgi:hypothetical protein